jgi:trimeric autotransporter adhesin
MSSSPHPTASLAPASAGKLPEDLIRLSVGIEDPSDLIHDISQAFELASNAHVANVRAVRRRSVTETAAAEAAATAASSASSSASSASPAGGPGGLTVSVPAASPTNKDGHLEPAVSLGCGTATAEDAALIARSEIARLQATVRVLKERIAEGEARAAAAEAARRLAVSGSAASVGDGATGGTANGGSPGGASSFRLSAPAAALPPVALPTTIVSAAVGALAAAVAVALLLGRRTT